MPLKRLLLSLLLAASISAQVRETIDVRVLELDVAVLDRNGKPVEGLTRDDFEVSLANKRADVTNFYAVRRGAIVDDTPATAVAKSEVKSETLIPTNLIIFVDDTRLAPRGKKRALDALRDYVKTNVGMNTSAILARWNGGNLDVRTRPTERPGPLLAEIDLLAKNPAQLLNSERRQLIAMIDMVFTSGYDPDSGRGERPPMEPEELRNAVFHYAQREAHETDRTLAALREAVQLASAFEGRRAVLYVAEGLPMQAGVELFEYWLKAASSSHPFLNPKIARWAQDAIKPTDFMAFDRSNRYRELARDAQRAGVLFFALDAAGVRPAEGSGVEVMYPITIVSPTILQSNAQDGLRYVAEETGGRLIANENNLGRGLAVISEQYATYYSLGVRAPSSSRAAKVSVKVKNRPKLRVVTARYRRPLSPDEEIERSVRTHLYTRATENPLGVTLGVGASSKQGDKCSVPVNVTAGKGAVWFALLDEKLQESGVRRADTPDLALGLRPGKYVLSVAVVAESGETSYLQGDVECR